MGSLITRIKNPSEAVYGVNILEREPDPILVGESVSTIGAVMDTPWGPTDEVVTCTSVAELFATFAPAEFANRGAYPSMFALLNKTFPSAFQVKRLAATGAARASRTADSAEPKASVVVTARHAGVSGDLIRTQFVANAGEAGNRDLIITIVPAGATAPTYSQRYANVVVASPLAVHDPGDPWVTVAPHGDFDAVPAADGVAVTLASGSDGVSVATDWTGSPGDFEGVRAFLDDALGTDVVFAAEPPDTMIDDINAALVAVCEEAGLIAPLCTPPGLTRSAAQAYADAYRSTRAVFTWPRVRTRNGFSTAPTQEIIVVDGAAFAAVAIASVQPQNSPGGAPGAPYLKGIVGLETPVASSEYESLRLAGVNGWRMSTANGGYIMNGGVTTQIANRALAPISRTRMFDYVSKSVAGFMELFVGRLADINLVRRVLGPVTRTQRAQVESFLASAQDDNIIRAWAVDWFGGNTPEGLALGRFVVLIEVGLYGSQDVIVLEVAVGQNVLINLAA